MNTDIPKVVWQVLQKGTHVCSVSILDLDDSVLVETDKTMISTDGSYVSLKQTSGGKLAKYFIKFENVISRLEPCEGLVYVVRNTEPNQDEKITCVLTSHNLRILQHDGNFTVILRQRFKSHDE